MDSASNGAEVLAVILGRTEGAASVFSVLVKRTYAIRNGQPVARTEHTSPFVPMDLYYDDGDPETTTIRQESELVAYKAASDVVVIANAYAPGGKQVEELSVGVEVAGRRKVFRVIGDRRCIYQGQRPPAFTDPMPFTQMEVRYERSYGGVDRHSYPEMPIAYPRNTHGTGFAIRNIPEAVDGLPLPNLEDLVDRLTPERIAIGEPSRWNDQPLPQGLGWFHRSWYPRSSFVGAIPAFLPSNVIMREEELGLVPAHQVALARQFRLPGFDVRFNNGASPGLALPRLMGGERVRLANLTPAGRLEFQLPTERPRIMLDIGLGENELDSELQTVCIRAEDLELDMIWQGIHPYPGVEWLPEMKRMVVQCV